MILYCSNSIISVSKATQFNWVQQFNQPLSDKIHFVKMEVSSRKFILALLLTFCIAFVSTSLGKKNDGDWKKKDPRDYSEADLERLFEQWEDADEDELEEDELPQWKREPPKVDMSKLDPRDPEGMLKASKKGRTLMMFATVSGNPDERDTEKISDLWHSSLFNAHIDTQKFIVGKDRILFMLQDGSKAWEVKDFLTRQERCAEVSIEGQNFPGAGANKDKKDEKEEL